MNIKPGFTLRNEPQALFADLYSLMQCRNRVFARATHKSLQKTKKTQKPQENSTFYPANKLSKALQKALPQNFACGPQ